MLRVQSGRGARGRREFNWHVGAKVRRGVPLALKILTRPPWPLPAAMTGPARGGARKENSGLKMPLACRLRGRQAGGRAGRQAMKQAGSGSWKRTGGEGGG